MPRMLQRAKADDGVFRTTPEKRSGQVSKTLSSLLRHRGRLQVQVDGGG